MSYGQAYGVCVYGADASESLTDSMEMPSLHDVLRDPGLVDDDTTTSAMGVRVYPDAMRADRRWRRGQ